MTAEKLSQIGELPLLEQIRKDFSKKSKNVLVGIGDDAAVVEPINKYLLATTDMMVEGIHFDLRFVTSYQLGFKLISVNVSDICAMGGEPYYLLLNIAINRNATKRFLDMFFDGVKDAISVYDTGLIGGDLSSSNKGMSISATVIGYADKYIRRSGAKMGDKIYVTGSLGDSACGLELLKKIKKPVPLRRHLSPSIEKGKGGGVKTLCFEYGLSKKTIEPLLRRHLLPEARNPKDFVHAATSMIDISDGLLIDMSRLCSESKAGARIYEEKIPMSPEMKKAAEKLGISPIKLALSGGEDYELLFTAPAGRKIKAISIGDIAESKKVIVDKKGREKPFSAEGYQHFGRL